MRERRESTTTLSVATLIAIDLSFQCTTAPPSHESRLRRRHLQDRAQVNLRAATKRVRSHQRSSCRAAAWFTGRYVHRHVPLLGAAMVYRFGVPSTKALLELARIGNVLIVSPSDFVTKVLEALDK